MVLSPLIAFGGSQVGRFLTCLSFTPVELQVDPNAWFRVSSKYHREDGFYMSLVMKRSAEHLSLGYVASLAQGWDHDNNSDWDNREGIKELDGQEHISLLPKSSTVTDTILNDIL